VIVVAIVLMATLPACERTERPEGVVERWLVSLNQGAAGRPDRYAPDDVSEQVVPGWRELNPGQLDRIEVGAHTLDPPSHLPAVPFRVVTVDGVQTVGTAHLEEGPSGWQIVSADAETYLPSYAPPFSADAGSPFGEGLPGWPIALAVGAALALGAVALVTIVQRRAHV
jgi:hypothetical protein